MARQQLLILALWGLASVAPARALSPAARDALVIGDCRLALAAGERAETAAERLAVARCLVLDGRAAEAVPILHDMGTYAAYADLVAGEALLESRRYGEAADRLTTVRLPGEAGERARLLLGRALVEAGRSLEAREPLRRLLTGDLAAAGAVPSPMGADPGEVRWWLAEGAVRRGEPDAAVPVWQMIWTHNPASPRAEQAAARLAAAAHPVPDVSTADGRSLVSARLSTLERQRSYVEALALRDLLPADHSQGGVRSLAGAAFRARDYPRAVALFARISAPAASERFDHALATSRTGDYAAAEGLYQALFEADPEHSLADLASYKVAWLSYDGGDLERAIELFGAHLRRYSRSEHADEARWFTAWSLYRLQRWADADAAFETLQRLHGGSALAVGAAYWRARITGLQGDAEGERTGLATVVRRWPYSGYAWFAARRLGLSPPRPLPPRTLAPDTTLAASRPGYQRGLELAAVGLDGWAREELSAETARAGDLSRAQRLALAGALVAAGSYPDAQRIAGSNCARPSDPAERDLREACWPRPVAAAVSRLSAAGGLDENVPYGIMNAESALKPWVTSPAGARGLMQLMPALAADLHQERYGDQPYHPDALYQPGYNAALGVTELSRLATRYRDARVQPSLPLVIAGYNGGAEAVDRWLAASPEGDPPWAGADYFTENIGYTETRQYVKRVLAYVRTYEAAWATR